MARADKVTAVAELTERFQSSDGAVLTEYRGLTVAQLAELRGSLGDSATFTVVKNTLTKLAANEAGVSSQLGDLLSGPSAIAFVKGDVVEAAKGLRDFSRANPLLVIKGGVLDGKAISPAEIERLAELESREVLLAKLAGGMKASLSQAAAVFNALPVQMAQLAEALRAKQEAAGGAADATTEASAAEAAAETSSTGAASTDEASTGAASTDEASTGAASTDEASTGAASTARPAWTRPAPARPAWTRPAPARPAWTRPAPARPAWTRPAPARPAPMRPAPSSRTARPDTISRRTERKGIQQSWRSSALTTCSTRSRR